MDDGGVVERRWKLSKLWKQTEIWERRMRRLIGEEGRVIRR